MSYHLTYLQAVVTGLVQGVTELFPVSSLGHNVLLPALIGGSWAKTLNVSAPGLAVPGVHRGAARGDGDRDDRVLLAGLAADRPRVLLLAGGAAGWRRRTSGWPG